MRMASPLRWPWHTIGSAPPLVSMITSEKSRCVSTFTEATCAMWIDSSSVPTQRGGYENGWNGRQILAHPASIEWTYPRLIDIAREAGAGPAATVSGEPPTRAMRGGNDAYNERQVARRADRSVAELLDEFATNRAATIRAVEAADEALFARVIRSAGGVTGPLAAVFHAVAVRHVLGHL